MIGRVFPSKLEKERVRGGLGIWGNEKCIQCGACCELYKNQYREEGKCSNQEIRDGKSYCRVHSDVEKRRWGIFCDSFFCGTLGNPYFVKTIFKERKKLRETARKMQTSP